jgi:uncharacterized protein (TIGR03435 family)
MSKNYSKRPEGPTPVAATKTEPYTSHGRPDEGRSTHGLTALGLHDHLASRQSVTRPVLRGLLLWAVFAHSFAATFDEQAPSSQNGAKSRHTFEVASVKPAAPLAQVAGQFPKSPTTKIDPGRVDIEATPLSSIIARAYKVKVFQISGEAWLGGARFDIHAKISAGDSTADVPEMLQSLLSDRFHLKAHQGMEELSIYALMCEKTGPRLSPAPTGYAPTSSVNVRPFKLDQFASFLYLALDRPIINETGLTGAYLFDMTPVVRDISQKASASQGNGMAEEPVGTGSFRLVKSLGLRLVPAKRKFPVVVIDSIETIPVEN